MIQTSPPVDPCRLPLSRGVAAMLGGLTQHGRGHRRTRRPPCLLQGAPPSRVVPPKAMEFVAPLGFAATSARRSRRHHGRTWWCAAGTYIPLTGEAKPMLDFTPVRKDATSQVDWISKVPFSFYAVHGTAAPGSAFTVSQRCIKRPGFGNSSTSVTLPGAGTYGLQLFDSVWSEGTSNPQSITIDVFDDGVLAGSFNVDRQSADPAIATELSAPFLFVEGNFALSGGPLEFRNGGSSPQTAALAARIWQFPETYSRPDPLAVYLRPWLHHVREGHSYYLRSAYEVLADGDVRTLVSSAAYRVPWGANGPPPGDYQVQVTGVLQNLINLPRSLAIRIYCGETLLHTETVAAGGSQTVDVAVDETLAFAGGRFDIRNGLADEIDEGETVNFQAADLLVKVWGPL